MPQVDENDLGFDGVSRRKFLALMGASLALAGGCSVRPAPPGEAVPYVDPPEGVVPGRPLFFATTMTFAGQATGLLVESHSGRPTKVEGNPDHPASRGATDIFHQASVLSLYDPDRAQVPTYLGQTRTWGDFLDAVTPVIKQERERRGKGLRLLTETVVSPTLQQQLQDFLKALPEAKWHVYEPVHHDAEWEAAQMAFGEPIHARYDLRHADVVLSLDADFLRATGDYLPCAADFIAGRRLATTAGDAAKATINRLYVVETAVSATGAKADHRLALRPREIEALARAVAAKLGISQASTLSGSSGATGAVEKWVAAVAKDLDAHRGRSLVLAGSRQPAIVHLLAHVINDRLGNVGKTLSYTDPIDAKPGTRVQSLRELVGDMNKGQVQVLLILGGNPVYAAPADLDFAGALEKVPLRIHYGLHVDETSYHCHWHLPEAHYLEAWSDARAFDGTLSLVQPLIEPLYQGRSAHELVAMLTALQPSMGREILRNHWRDWWQKRKEQGGFEPFWQKALHDGVVPNTALQPKKVALKAGWEKHLQGNPAPATRPASEASGEMDLVFEPDPSLCAGSWANNGWLQELPKPITKIAWGNAAIMSPKTAQELHVANGSYAHGGEHGGYMMPVVQLQLGDRTVKAPAWIMPGHADGAITVYLGHGRPNAGRVGSPDGHPVGFNAYLLRTADQPWFAPGLKVVKTTDTELVACTQAHQSMEGREPVRAGTLAEYRKAPNTIIEKELANEQAVIQRPRDEVTLYESFDYGPPKHRWAMAIDLTACVGCNSCVVACQAENNIPVVGKDQVSRGREMHWIRIDRYLDGPEADPERFYFQPLPCMHCEHAPCEYVCPVEATVHSAEGLNDMVYNRCVGTRFCSNNCPYKVRRFNFLLYSDYDTLVRRLQYNPDVTVRSRGVMEKCSYCVQRIRHAEFDAEAADRPLVDGEVVTACQAACPTGAIRFGDMNDPKAAIKPWKESPLHYRLLGEQNTSPRTTYLAEMRNPNPELEA